MPHFAARAGLVLAIKMQAGPRLGGELRPGGAVFADEMRHPAIGMRVVCTQRPAGDGADVVLELADGAAVHSPVAAVVYARRELIEQEGIPPVPDVEHLDADHADVAEGVGEFGGDLAGALLMR